MNKELNALSRKLSACNETISIAESVTAGTIQASFSIASNSMDFFEGGVTVYSIDQKVRLLKVNRAHAAKWNCVSKRVASEMAQGAAKLFGTDWALAITGYASPVPEKKIKSVFAWIAILHRKKIVLTKKISGPDLSPQKVQAYFKKKSIELLLSAVTKQVS